jgi:hypothetical protein
MYVVYTHKGLQRESKLMMKNPDLKYFNITKEKALLHIIEDL